MNEIYRRNTRAAHRTCLRCGKVFYSPGPGRRRCSLCQFHCCQSEDAYGQDATGRPPEIPRPCWGRYDPDQAHRPLP